MLQDCCGASAGVALWDGLHGAKQNGISRPGVVALPHASQRRFSHTRKAAWSAMLFAVAFLSFPPEFRHRNLTPCLRQAGKDAKAQRTKRNKRQSEIISERSIGTLHPESVGSEFFF
jgi:hypothetical protein